MLQIECLYYPSCGSLEELPSRIASALAAEEVRAEVQHRVISVQEGLERSVRRSPTVLINGVDIAEVGAQGMT